MHIYLSQPDAVCINITVRIVLGPDRRQPTQDVALNAENMPKVQNTISCDIKLRKQNKTHCNAKNIPGLWNIKSTLSFQL